LHVERKGKRMLFNDLREKPYKSQLSTFKLNSLFALALIMMISGMVLGWYLVHIPVIEMAQRVLQINHEYARGAVIEQQSMQAMGADGSPTTVASASPMVDPHLLAPHMETGWHLSVPAIGLNASVETVNVALTGRLDLPQLHQWDGVGWYQRGPLPGMPGSAVIDGYAVHPNGVPAALDKLSSLHVGDLVKITDRNGAILQFHVLTVDTYVPDQAPLSTIFGDTSGSYLNLITTTGNWTSGRHHAVQQIVVRTVKDQ
jgi:Sortase domain